MKRFLFLLLMALLLLQGCGGRPSPKASLVGLSPDQVVAVVVGWDRSLDRVPPPQRTTDRARFAPLLAAMGRITHEATPPDMNGPPVHITLELKGGKQRGFELWGALLVDLEAKRTYWLPDDLYAAFRAALEPLSPPPISPPGKLSGMITVDDLVRALQEHGAKATRDTGEEIRFLLFGASSGRVIELLGQKVQVYTMESPAAAAKVAAIDPYEMPVEWIAPPKFVAIRNLVVTVVIPEPQVADKIVAYLDMVRGQ